MTSSTVSDPTRSMLRPRSYARNPTQNPPLSISPSAAKASRPEPETTRAGRVATRNAFPSRAIAPQRFPLTAAPYRRGRGRRSKSTGPGAPNSPTCAGTVALLVLSQSSLYSFLRRFAIAFVAVVILAAVGVVAGKAYGGKKFAGGTPDAHP